MSIDPSVLTYSACALYGFVVCGCLLATRLVGLHRQADWQGRVWLFLAALFVALAASRLMGIEEGLREALREALREGGNYGGRRGFQAIIAGTIIMLTATGFGVAFFKAARRVRGKRSITALVALFAGAAMVFLVAVRMVSIHVLDWFLYGPLKLNWVGDIGLSLIVLAASLYFVKLVRDRARERAGDGARA